MLSSNDENKNTCAIFKYLYRHKGKVKLSVLTGRGDQQGCETSRLPHFLDIQLIDGGEVRFYSPGRVLVLISVTG
jgi:hypothetical protein